MYPFLIRELPYLVCDIKTYITYFYYNTIITIDVPDLTAVEANQTTHGVSFKMDKTDVDLKQYQYDYVKLHTIENSIKYVTYYYKYNKNILTIDIDFKKSFIDPVYLKILNLNDICDLRSVDYYTPFKDKIMHGCYTSRRKITFYVFRINK